MRLKDKYGDWACVAGSAEGLGFSFCHSLAKRGFNLLMIDRKKEILISSSASIREKYDVEIEILQLNLEDLHSIQVIIDKIKFHGCRMLIYNAAYGPVKPFLSNSMKEIETYLNVNARTPLHLVHRFIENFENQSTGILLLSSLAGFRGTRYVVPYAATKAFTWNLAEGLYYEFKDKPVDISVCCPGPIDTPNFRTTNPNSYILSPKPAKAVQVAEKTLKKFGRQLFIIPGNSTWISHFLLNKLLPRRLASALHNHVMKKMYD